MILNRFFHFHPPCRECPYKLGLVHTIVNPCPQCSQNHYQMFAMFQKQIAGTHASLDKPHQKEPKAENQNQEDRNDQSQKNRIREQKKLEKKLQKQKLQK